MISPAQKQQVMRNANAAQAHARRVLAGCVAGLAVVVLLALFGTLPAPNDERAVAASTAAGRTEADGSAAALRRETFEARRAYHEAGRRSGPVRQAAH